MKSNKKTTKNKSVKQQKITIKNVSRDRLNISSDELIERFARGDSSRNTEGSGLGLAISESIVTIHKGKIYAEKKNEHTLVICVLLPVLNI